MIKVLKYYFKSAQLDPILQRSSDTIVVFVHGILSDSKTAFKQKSGNGFFWDNIENLHPFSRFDFAMFSYGRIDVSYLLEKEWPINNFIKISLELYGAISKYKNVIFIAHSQGGLLAKCYSSLYHEKQGIFLTTLHTPHRNKSITLMKINDVKIWDDCASFRVPHIFCGSIYDNKIVKPDNALVGCKDVEYMSSDHTKKSLGHSHLNTFPDAELLKKLEVNVDVFINSGLNKSLDFYPHFQSERVVLFSRSNSKIKKHLSLIGSDYPKNSKNSKHSLQPEDEELSGDIVRNFCSVNYILRHLKNRSINDYSIVDLDRKNPDSIEETALKNYIHCFDSRRKNKRKRKKKHKEETKGFGLNPYKRIPFFTSDFHKKSLVINGGFYDIFVGNIEKSHVKNTNTTALYEIYDRSVLEYKESMLRKLYSLCLIKREIGFYNFEKNITAIVKNIVKNKEKRVAFNLVYETSKKVFHNDGGYCISLRDIEMMVSFFMKSDGELYWLDRDVRTVFT